MAKAAGLRLITSEGSIPAQSVWDMVDRVTLGLVLLPELPDFPCLSVSLQQSCTPLCILILRRTKCARQVAVALHKSTQNGTTNKPINSLVT